MPAVEQDLDRVVTWPLKNGKRRKREREGRRQGNVRWHTGRRSPNSHLGPNLRKHLVAVGVDHLDSQLMIGVRLGAVVSELQRERDGKRARVLLPPENGHARPEDVCLALRHLRRVTEECEVQFHGRESRPTG